MVSILDIASGAGRSVAANAPARAQLQQRQAELAAQAEQAELGQIAKQRDTLLARAEETAKVLREQIAEMVKGAEPGSNTQGLMEGVVGIAQSAMTGFRQTEQNYAALGGNPQDLQSVYGGIQNAMAAAQAQLAAAPEPEAPNLVFREIEADGDKMLVGLDPTTGEEVSARIPAGPAGTTLEQNVLAALPPDVGRDSDEFRSLMFTALTNPQSQINVAAAPPVGYRNVFDEQGRLTHQELIEGGPAARQTPEAAAKIALINTAISSVETFKGMLFPNGPEEGPDRTLLVQMMTRVGQGREARVLMLDAIEAKLRAESGAAVPDTEVARIGDRIMPSILDNADTIRTKITLLEAFLQTTLDMIEGREVQLGDVDMSVVISNLTIDQLAQIDAESLTDEEQEAYRVRAEQLIEAARP